MSSSARCSSCGLSSSRSEAFWAAQPVQQLPSLETPGPVSAESPVCPAEAAAAGEQACDQKLGCEQARGFFCQLGCGPDAGGQGTPSGHVLVASERVLVGRASESSEPALLSVWDCHTLQSSTRSQGRWRSASVAARTSLPGCMQQAGTWLAKAMHHTDAWVPLPVQGWKVT